MRLRLTLRSLLRAPAFTLASVATIALAVCLSTTVFAVVDGVLFKPLPYPRAGELYAIGGLPTRGSWGGGLSPADLAHLDAASGGLVITASGGRIRLKHPEDPAVDIRGIRIDERFFDVIGVRPLIGGFTREDHQTARSAWRGSEPIAAIVSHRLWRQRVAPDVSALGSVIELGGRRIRIAGVLPPGFVFPDFMLAEVDVLFAMADDVRAPGDRWERYANGLVRVAPEAVVAATARFDAAMASTRHEYGPAEDPGDEPYDRVLLTPISEMLGANERPFFTLAFAGAALLVLIACVNVTSLVLARTHDRAREVRVRAALGASRADIARLVLGEMMVVSVAGAILGLLLAKPALALAVSELPARLFTLKPPVVDVRVTLFALLTPAVVMVALALVPLRRAFADAPISTTTSGSTPRQHSFGASSLLALESGFGVALLILGTFVIASFAGLRQEPIGLASDRLGVVDLLHRETLDDPGARAALQDRILERIEAVPGVARAALVGAPLLERMYSALDVDTGNPDDFVQEIPVSARFFEIAGLRLLEGRLPSAAEIVRGDRLAVLSQPAARALFGDGPAVGRRVKGYEETFDVVGVVEDVRLGSQNEGTSGEVFTPMSELGRLFATYLFLASGDIEAVAPRVAGALAADIPGVAIERAVPLDEAAAGTVSLQRFQASLFGIAGGAASLLLAVGVTGIVAGSVRRRWREAGIRSALGASGGRIVRMLIADHLRPAATGITLGLAGSWWMKDILRRFLYQLEPTDLRVWALASTGLLAIVVVAAWLPARRAAAADPAVVLRAD